MKERWKFIVAGALTLAWVLGVSPGERTFAAEPIVLKYADPSKADSSRTKAAAETMLEIEKRTGGRVKHEFYWSESLLKAKDILKGIQGGTCDIGDTTAVVYHTSRFPVWQFTQLLFVGGNDQYAVTKACNELYDTNQILRDEFEKQGVKMLTTNALTPTVIVSRKSLKRAEDFKGLRVRAVGPVAKWAAALGGSPSPLTFYEVSEALARGIIDASQTYVYATHAYKFYEHCKFLPLNGVSHIYVEYVISMDTLKKMPPDVQKIYLETWRDFYLERCIKYHDEEFEKQINDFKAAGVTVYSLTAEELAEWKKPSDAINEEYYEQMKKIGVDGKKLVDQYQALYNKYERKK